MKRMKKILSFLLTMVMVLSMAFSSMAAQEGELTGGSITITNAVAGQEYSIYQILYLESYDKDAGAYSYKANSAWKDWLEMQSTYVSIDDQGYVTWVTDADAAAFAKEAQAHAKESEIVPDKTIETESDKTVEFKDLKLGYYLVDTTLGTICSLDTTNPSTEIKEKNEAPTVEKEVEEDSKVGTDDAWGKVNDADINQTVNFKATVIVKAGAENYTLHDKMSEGLTFDKNSIVIKIGENTVDSENYTIRTDDLTDGCTFEIAFHNDYIAGLTPGTEIVVTYSATLNENAVIAGEGNPNDIYLKYGDKNKLSETPKSETITYTWDAKVFKYTGETPETGTALSGAQFSLSTKEQPGENEYISFIAKGKTEENVPIYQVCNVSGCTHEGHTTVITTDDTGKFQIQGLDAGTYYLHEIKAPDGYNKLAGPVEIKIEPTEKEEDNVVGLEYTSKEIGVVNNSGTELPSTGGAGTTIFYIVGGILVVAAGVLLVVRKRAGAEE